MNKKINVLLKAVMHFFYSKLPLVLIILLCLSLGISIAGMLNLSESLIESQALETAKLYANILQTSRQVYNQEAVNRLQGTENVVISHKYQSIPNSVPVPSTFLIQLATTLRNSQDINIYTKVFSDYPFKNNGVEVNSTISPSEQNILDFLRNNPTEDYHNVENVDGIKIFEFAKAEIMEATCVQCHNTHPDSPKRDWKIGDVRGAIAVNIPIESYTNFAQISLSKISFIFVILVGSAITGIILVIKRLRNISQELENQVNQRTLQLKVKNNELVVERRKSDRLLFNALPMIIASRLKQGEINIADWFSEVTILFADIVGFTGLSNQIPPHEMVRHLNEIFSAIDRLSEKYKLEKIRTIGDNYMVAAGVPVQRPDHAEAIANMALDIQREIVQFNQKNQTELAMRIGINTGSVIGGVIGRKRLVYDIWGDAVNTASRMESHGVPGQIQVTQETYERLKNTYVFSSRGTILVKGKGEMETYFLLRKK